MRPCTSAYSRSMRPANAVARDYIERLTADRIADIEKFLNEEARGYGIGIARPVSVELYPPVAERPPERAANSNVLQNMWWSLKLRMYARRAVARVRQAAPAGAHLRALPRPCFLQTVPHSVGMQKGLVGVVHAFAAAGMTRTNNVVIAHEILHTLGASDKYDPDTLAPLYPIGYAEPDRTPRYPQSFTEIMAGRYAVDAQHLRDARVARPRSSWAMPPRSRSAGSGNEYGARSRAAARRGPWQDSHRLVRLHHPRRRIHRAAGRQWHRQIPVAAHAGGFARRPPRASCGIDGRDIATVARREVAMRLGFLPQDPEAAPQGSLRESALLGRFAHLGFWEAAGAADAQRVARALADVGLEAFARARTRHAVGRRTTPRLHCPPAGSGAVYLPARRTHQSPGSRAAARHSRQPAPPHA